MRNFLLAGLTATLFAAPAAAQETCAEYARTPAVGGWSQWQSKDGRFKLALIGTEQREGKDMYWIEMQGTQTGPGGNSGIMQILVPSFPFEMSAVKGMILKTEGKPAMKANDQMIGMMSSHMGNNQASTAIKDCASWTKVGDESITVPAGTFKTIHFKDTKSTNEVWVSHDVPFGLVKGIFPGKASEVVLTGNGTDAKSSITETPMDMGSMMNHQ